MDEQKKRNYVINEIVDSENSYLADLYTLIIYYITPLRNGKWLQIFNAWKGGHHVTFLFSTIDFIFESNSRLKHKLEENRERIGTVFTEEADNLLSYYGAYMNHQKDASDTISELSKSNKEFKTFLENCKAHEEVKNLDLNSFLIKPFQRITKYPLLLQELDKNTPSTHPDSINLKAALKKVQHEVDTINSGKRKVDNQKKLVELSKCVSNIPPSFNILTPTRTFIYEGLVNKISGNHDQERQFFLFSDSLMYCKKKSDNSYVCRDIIYLKVLRLDEMPDDPTHWKINRTDKNLTYTIYSSQPIDKTNWISKIKELQDKYNPQSLASSSRDLSQTGKKTNGPKPTRVYYTNNAGGLQHVTLPLQPDALSGTFHQEVLTKLKKQFGPDHEFLNHVFYLTVRGNAKPIKDEENIYEVVSNALKRNPHFGSDQDNCVKLAPDPNRTGSPAFISTSPSREMGNNISSPTLISRGVGLGSTRSGHNVSSPNPIPAQFSAQTLPSAASQSSPTLNQISQSAQTLPSMVKKPRPPQTGSPVYTVNNPPPATNFTITRPTPTPTGSLRPNSPHFMGNRTHRRSNSGPQADHGSPTMYISKQNNSAGALPNMNAPPISASNQMNTNSPQANFSGKPVARFKPVGKLPPKPAQAVNVNRRPLPKPTNTVNSPPNSNSPLLSPRPPNSPTNPTSPLLGPRPPNSPPPSKWTPSNSNNHTNPNHNNILSSNNSPSLKPHPPASQPPPQANLPVKRGPKPPSGPPPPSVIQKANQARAFQK